MVNRALLACMLASLLAISSLPVSEPVAADAPVLKQRSSTTSIFLTDDGSATNISVMGEWNNWTEPVQMVLQDGYYQASLDLDPGLYCYKLVIDGVWSLDVDNPERTFCEGVENSLLRVEDHSLPLLTLQGGAGIENGVFRATIEFWASSNAAAPAGISVELEHEFAQSQGLHYQWNESHWTLDLEVDMQASGHQYGKYTFRISAVDENGAQAVDILLPFWYEEQSFGWDDALIYMLMTDRFVNANASNDANSSEAAAGAGWGGGDFAGVTKRIESGYFEQMGVNALWLTPFNTAAAGTETAGDGVHQVSAYHGYWPVEPRQVDPRLGTDAELEQMIDAAHARGIRVMMDFVVNHVHEDHPYYTQHPDWFTEGCLCGTQDCDWTEQRLDCRFRDYMPDIDWKNRNASEQMIADGLWWLERFDLDGARIDAVKHIDDLAVYNFATQVNQRFERAGTDYYLKGETAMGWSGHDLEANQPQYEMINRYIGEDGLDGQADFVLYHAVVDNVFTTGAMDYQHLDYWTSRSQDQYSDGAVMVPFIGSHDSSRFSSRADNGTQDEWNQWAEQGLPGQPGSDEPYAAALQAFTWLLTTPGAPMIYAGDEYGEYGGADPDNRHMLRDSSQWNTREISLQENVSLLGRIRAEADVLRQGAYTSLHNSSDVVAYAMQTEDDAALIVLNRGAAVQLDLDLSDLVGNWSDGEIASSIGASVLEITAGTTSITFDSAGVAIFFAHPEQVPVEQPDSDGDGIPDSADMCPDSFGYAENSGCAECFPAELNIPCEDCGLACFCACGDDGTLGMPQCSEACPTQSNQTGNQTEGNSTGNSTDDQTVNDGGNTTQTSGDENESDDQSAEAEEGAEQRESGAASKLVETRTILAGLGTLGLILMLAYLGLRRR